MPSSSAPPALRRLFPAPAVAPAPFPGTGGAPRGGPLFHCPYARGNRHKAIEAARVVAAIFVLCAAVHSDPRKYLTIVAALRIFPA